MTEARSIDPIHLPNAYSHHDWPFLNLSDDFPDKQTRLTSPPPPRGDACGRGHHCWHRGIPSGSLSETS